MSFSSRPYFGSYVLETLTVGMYGESRNAIREYIQNAFDSIQKGRREKLLRISDGLIEVSMAANRNSLSIRDNGSGIRASQAVAILTNIGASSKDHRRDAGFRGIGRLSGIGFTDTVTFSTKVKGEEVRSVVTYDAKLMRDLMSPSSEEAPLSAEDVLQRCITVETQPDANEADHFFEVCLEGWNDAPIECTEPLALRLFLSQIAPVSFAPEFKQGTALLVHAADAGMKIDHVAIIIMDGDEPAVKVTKAYRDVMPTTKGDAEVRCEPIPTGGGKWWGWVGRKDTSATFEEDEVAGIRVRVKNIQIDAKEVFRDIFRLNNKGDGRFQEYYVGEIHVEPGFLIPNARRDGFEDNESLKIFRRELKSVAKTLVQEVRAISDQEKFKLDKLQAEVSEKQSELATLKRAGFANHDKAQSFVVAVTEIRDRIAQAVRNADIETRAQLNVLADRCADMRSEVSSNLAPPPHDCADELDAARVELLGELLTVLEQELAPQVFTAARKALEKHYDLPLE
jgi:hypothetical protein